MKLFSMDTVIKKLYKKVFYSLINIFLFFLSILSSNIHSGLNFIQVDTEKQYLYNIRVCIYVYL